MLKKLKNSLYSRHPIMANYFFAIWINVRRRILYRSKRLSSADYSSITVPLSCAPPVVCDIAFNLYLRALVEGGYRTVIEIGAHSGERIFHLKQVVPQIDAYGLDIVKTYHIDQLVEGVSLRRFSLDFFKQERDKAIVLSRGTMANMSEEFLFEFFKTLHAHKYDIAMCEQAPFHETQLTSRRSPNSFYHPYPKLLNKFGYRFDQNYMAATWHTCEYFPIQR